jgi:hypothetical protein
MLTDAFNRLKSPTANMTWTQLAGATVFVIVVALMWRQVTLFIMKEM